MYMKKAFELAKKADPYPNPKVGAIIVKNGKIIGKGFHKKAGQDHAEVVAIKDAKNAKGATLYVTMEPCSHKKKRTPPCTKAIIEAGISKVVFGQKDLNPKVRGAKILEKAGIEVVGPTDPENKINDEYYDNIGSVVAIKMAMSLDGKTATNTGDSKWISSKESRKIVHKLRSTFDAVMVGAGTIIKDNPKLTSRIDGGRNPTKIIVDGKLKIPLNSKIFKGEKPIIVTSSKNVTKYEDKAKIIQFDQIDFRKLRRILSRMGIKKILVEGGCELNGSIFPIVNKMFLFIGPIIIGGKDAKGVIGGEGIKFIKEAKHARNLKVIRIEDNLLLEFDL